MSKKEHRLDKIYTRSGDSGKTSLALGSRLSKSDLHIKAIGDIDELNCQLGVLLASIQIDTSVASNQAFISFVKTIQNTLFDIGAELAMNNSQYPPLKQYFIDQLETKLDTLNQQLPALKEFILPGGSLGAAQCHLARAICRRAERQLVEFCTQQDATALSFEQPLKYLNRLSDYLFVAARYLNYLEQSKEVYWQANNAPN
jgi:cob(I)alamin adenosyltransferase